MADAGAARYDVKTARRAEYTGRVGRFDEIHVPERSYLAVDGAGDPNTAPAYAEAVEALYPVAYTLKFTGKAAGRDSVVAPLEGLWRADDPSAFVARRKDEWSWTLLLALPPWVSEGGVHQAIDTVAAKKDLPALARLRVHTFTEGRCVQTLHVGPYDDEGPVLHELHEHYLPDHDLTFAGDHHEIYLGDPRRAAPEKLRTLLRQPVRPR